MKTPIVGYQGKQLEIDFDLDRPEFSICPKCSSDLIRLADGYGICGWSENQAKNDDRSVEPSISIPCTVKQPNQPELKGVIKQDLGSSFLVDIPSEESTVTVPKLFVYPDLSRTVRQIEKNPSKNYSPSNGSIAENSYLLGEIQISPSKSSDTFYVEVAVKLLNGSDKSPSNNLSPSKNQRKRGQGSGTVHYRRIRKKGKEYQQAYYHYEIWSQGSRMIKSSKYIPKKMEAKIIRMNNEKVPVEKILKVLESKSKRRRKS